MACRITTICRTYCRRNSACLTAPRPIWPRNGCQGCATIRAAIYSRWACCSISSRPASGRSARARRCVPCGARSGRAETLRAMRRRLWRDPHPPRSLRADYPPWLQEVVLRCLEIEPVRRYPTASQLAFDLTHPDQVRLTMRSERMKRDPLSVAWRRRFNQGVMAPRAKSDVAAQLASSPIVAVALDTAEGEPELNEALRMTTERILATLPSARLACLNVLKLNRIAIDRTLDEQGSNKHIDRLVALRHWAT